MKRLLLLTLIIVTVTFAGVLQGSAVHQERIKSISLNEYPETMPSMIPDPLLDPMPY